MIETNITAPADEAVSTTPAAQIDTTPTAQIDTAPAANVPGFLPKDYLANGYYATTDKGAKYLRPEFVGEYAETMAALLSDMKHSAFTGLLREMKRSKKTTLPFEARMTAAAEMLPKAMALVYRKKAPALLVSFIKDNLDHIQNDSDWTAYYRFMEATAAFLTAQQKGGDS